MSPYFLFTHLIAGFSSFTLFAIHLTIASPLFDALLLSMLNIAVSEIKFTTQLNGIKAACVCAWMFQVGGCFDIFNHFLWNNQMTLWHCITCFNFFTNKLNRRKIVAVTPSTESTKSITWIIIRFLKMKPWAIHNDTQCTLVHIISKKD